MMNTPSIQAKAKKDVFLISGYLLFLAGLSLYLMLIPSNTQEPNFTLETLFLNVVGTVVIFSPILYIWWRSSGEVTLNPMVSQNIKPKPVLSIMALAVVLPAALMPVDVLVDYFLTLLPDGISTAAQSINEQSNAIYIVQQMEHSALVIVSLYIALAAMPAIIEEFVFRGILQHRMQVSGLKPIWAIGLSSLIFCVIHLQLVNLLPMMILSSILGWLYYHGQTLHYSVLFHALNNAFSITLLIALEEAPNTDESSPWFWVISVGAIFISVMLLKSLHTTLRSEDIAHPNNAQ
ncbi:MAG: CPBP family intramembrane glutamic endopeptidase [Bacteroidota bacterium]|nr:CPBP family intramembrane glutamic endopeptidase [Bacteroidota bacterium]